MALGLKRTEIESEFKEYHTCTLEREGHLNFPQLNPCMHCSDPPLGDQGGGG